MTPASSAWAEVQFLEALADPAVHGLQLVDGMVGGDSNVLGSLQITSLLKELGAKKVFSKADDDVQAKFLLRMRPRTRRCSSLRKA